MTAATVYWSMAVEQFYILTPDQLVKSKFETLQICVSSTHGTSAECDYKFIY